MNMDKIHRIIGTLVFISIITVALIINNRLYFDFTGAVLHRDFPTDVDQYIYFNFYYFSFAAGIIGGLILALIFSKIKVVFETAVIIVTIGELIFLNYGTFVTFSTLEIFLDAFIFGITIILILMLSQLVFLLRKKNRKLL